MRVVRSSSSQRQTPRGHGRVAGALRGGEGSLQTGGARMKLRRVPRAQQWAGSRGSCLVGLGLDHQPNVTEGVAVTRRQKEALSRQQH